VIVDVRGRHIAFREILVAGRTEQILMAIYPEGSLISEFADAALSFAQRLLEVELATGHNAGMVRRRTRAGLLDMLLHSRGTPAELAERLLYHGIEPREPWRMLAFSAITPVAGPSSLRPAGQATQSFDPALAEAVADEFLATIDHVFEESGVPFVSRSGRGEVLVLSPLDGSDEPEAVRDFVLEAVTAVAGRLRGGARVVAGVSGSCSALEGLPRAVGQARLALRHGLVRGEAPVMLFDDLGVRYKALDSLPDDVLRELRDGVVGRLEAADAEHGSELLATLEAYLVRGFSMGDTATELYIHRNTLRKRVGRIEAITALDLATSGGQAEAYLSVRAAEVLAIRGG
jgi:hypothetical protein